jgi:L-threonylcarbamoyladenylate synthase
VTLSSAELQRLVSLLEAGGVIACPTETFVGLLAAALDANAVARVCALKGRSRLQPIGVLVPDVAALVSVAREIPALAYELAERHWPGPLSLVLRAQPDLPAELCKEGKISARVPGPSPALELVRAFGRPLTATSANLTGQAPACTSAEVRAAFPQGLAAIVEGVAPGGLASTLLDISAGVPVVLRAGAIPLAALGLNLRPTRS